MIEIKRVLDLTAEIAEVDAESALAAFKSSAGALSKVSVEQFDGMGQRGLADHEKGHVKSSPMLLCPRDPRIEFTPSKGPARTCRSKASSTCSASTSRL